MWQTVEGCATGSVDFFPLDFIFISRALVFCLRACLCEGGTGVADRREPSGLLGIESRASGSAASALNHSLWPQSGFLKACECAFAFERWGWGRALGLFPCYALPYSLLTRSKPELAAHGHTWVFPWLWRILSSSHPPAIAAPCPGLLSVLARVLTWKFRLQLTPLSLACTGHF